MPHTNLTTRFAIFRDTQLIERDHGDIEAAKARLEHFANTAPDHSWWYVMYNSDQRFAEERRPEIENAVREMDSPVRWLH